MSDSGFRGRGRFFEEFAIGQQVITAGRTITETDIVNFAGLSGDYNRIHTDDAYAAEWLFGERVAHGVLILSIASGLAVQTGMIEDTVLAFRELDWKFSKPVMIGDTIHVILEVTETKSLPRLGGGNVLMKVQVFNQKGDVVQRGNWTMLVKSKP